VLAEHEILERLPVDYASRFLTTSVVRCRPHQLPDDVRTRLTLRTFRLWLTDLKSRNRERKQLSTSRAGRSPSARLSRYQK